MRHTGFRTECDGGWSSSASAFRSERHLRILIVSQYYPPEAVPIPGDLAQGLVRRGHSVRVLTGYPNYPKGEIFSGYGQKWREQERHGEVLVSRVPLYMDHSHSAVKRIMNYLSFGLSAATAVKTARTADVIYVYATQMSAAFGPWLWRILGGRPYVLHVQDLWPDSIVGSSMVSEGRAGRLISRMLEPWLRSVYRRAAAVVGIAPTMVETLVSRGVCPDRAHLIYNWAGADETFDTALSPVKEPRTEVVYAGNVGDMQDLKTAVRAVHAAADAGVGLTIIGDGVAREGLRRLVFELGATNIRFVDPVPRERMAGIYSRADYALVSLKDMPAFYGTIPSKFQAALAAGVPVITTVQGDVRTIVDEADIGFTADAESVSSLESILRAAAKLNTQEREEMSQRGRTVYGSRFSREAGISRIEEVLADSAKGK
ncbi:glycosyltransferase family 4 protein [Glutamicibacter sp. BSL13]